MTRLNRILFGSTRRKSGWNESGWRDRLTLNEFNFSSKSQLQSMQEKAELVKTFSRASLKVQAMVTKKVLSDDEKAELQGLFQQATVGDGNMWKMLNDPKFLVDGDVLAKTNSWMPLRGMSKEEAMERYVDRVEILIASHHVHFAPSRTSSYASLQSASTTFTNLSR